MGLGDRDLPVYNYYPRDVHMLSGDFSAVIPAGSVVVLSAAQTGGDLGQGALVRFFLLSNNQSVRLATYRLKRSLAELHIGQITTRFSGGTWDDQMVVSSNAVQGRPYIRIHNATNLPLRLNNNILVKPNEMTRYSGRHHFGVPLGLVLTDIDRRYRQIQITKPVTDVYYGIISEAPQPLYGGWQKVFSTADVDYSSYYDAYGHVLSL